MGSWSEWAETRREASIKGPLLDSTRVVSRDTLFACQSEMEECVPRKILLQKRVRSVSLVKLYFRPRGRFVRAFYKNKRKWKKRKTLNRENARYFCLNVNFFKNLSSRVRSQFYKINQLILIDRSSSKKLKFERKMDTSVRRFIHVQRVFVHSNSYPLQIVPLFYFENESVRASQRLQRFRMLCELDHCLSISAGSRSAEKGGPHLPVLPA